MKRLMYICWLLLANVVLGQEVMPGASALSGLKVHGSRDYRAHSQNFAIARNQQGILFFGNFAGVLEFDGVFWKTIPTANVTKVSAVYVDKQNRVLVGGKDEFGCLAPDQSGALSFKSISAKQTGFGAVISIFETNKGAYFITRNRIFLWDGQRVQSWKSQPDITSAFFIGGNIYVFRKGPGLTVFNNGTFSVVRISSELEKLQDVNSMIDANGRTLILTTNQGLYDLENQIITRFSDEANRILLNREVSGGMLLRDGSLAILLSGGQILNVFPQSGKAKSVITPHNGLEDEHFNAWLEDESGTLWLALNNGIAQWDINAQMSEYGEFNGLKGQVNDVTRFGGRLYCGTSNGLYFLDNEGFSPVGGIRLAVWSLAQTGGMLYAATSKGIFRITRNQEVNQLTGEFSLAIFAPDAHSGQIYAGLENGAEVISPGGGNRRLDGIHGQVEKIVGDKEGNMWFETPGDGIFKWAPEQNVTHYNTGKGLPTLLLNRIAVTSEGVLVSNAKGIYRYEKAVDQFVPYKALTSKPASWKGELTEDSNGNIWTTNGDSRLITLFENKQKGRFTAQIKPFLPLADRTINVIYPDSGKAVWFGGDEGLVRFDLGIKKNYDRGFPAYIRQIKVKGDTLLFSGFIGAAGVPDSLKRQIGKLKYKFNDISFEFSAASLLPQDNLEYQFFLENFDKTWTDWTNKNQKEYTNLPPGNYRFRVRARNIYETGSKEAFFSFTILAPFYRQWWAFIIYTLLIAATIYFINKQRRAFVLNKTRNLENLIRERTEEVVNQKEELEQQSEQLSATNDQLERIDDFVKSINSEVNTGKLFQLVLERLCLFQNVDSASALIHNRATDSYQFIAITGGIDLTDLENVSMSYGQAERRYMENGKEVFEDIFLKNNFRQENLDSSIEDIYAPKSLITILIRVEGEVKSFITLENTDHENAFGPRDFTMVRNLKEHLIAAYIKTDILENLENTLSNLKAAQEELIRQERLASVGSLTKGIVDRILNPLNYINNFSQSSGRLLQEITEVTDKHQDGLSEDEKDDLESSFGMLQRNLEKIYEHGNSTTRIVKDMQKLLRGKSTEFFVTELNPFLDSKCRSGIQEVLNEYKDAKVKLTFDLNREPVKVSLLPYEFAQVLTNVISNACYALLEKVKIDKVCDPEIIVSSKLVDNHVVIRLRDNGKGIPVKETEQLFNPFFTTKPTSKGTGLGLYMSKDIIEYHKGRMSVNSKEGEFTEVEILLPVVR